MTPHNPQEEQKGTVKIVNDKNFPYLNGMIGEIQSSFDFNGNAFYKIKASNEDPRKLKNSYERKYWEKGDFRSLMEDSFVAIEQNENNLYKQNDL